MKRKLFTIVAAVFAIGSAATSAAPIKSLLLNQGWHFRIDGTDAAVSTATALAACPNESDTPCAYHFDESASTFDSSLTRGL